MDRDALILKKETIPNNVYRYVVINEQRCVVCDTYLGYIQKLCHPLKRL